MDFKAGSYVEVGLARVGNYVEVGLAWVLNHCHYVILCPSSIEDVRMSKSHYR